MLSGAICTAGALLVQGWSAGAPPTEAVPPRPPAAVEVEQPLQIDLAVPDDPRWELTRVEVQLDGKPLESSASEGDPAPSEAPRPLWSGLVAPGPHTLVALLFFKTRVPDDPVGAPPETVQVVTRHRWEAKPIRPLVLLITPVRPTRPPATDSPIWAAVARPS